jgi:hypothetical protein
VPSTESIALTHPVSAGEPELYDEITLDKGRVIVRCIDLPLSAVKLDPANPRVANTFAVGPFDSGDDQQRHLADLLWADSDVRSLYQSVLANQGLIERIIVRHDGVVAEGNCRTVVYQKLAAAAPNDPNWKRIPARVLPEDISERQVSILLGELHVGGKNKWSAFEKAGHIHKMSSEFGLTQEEIAKLLKMSKTAVNYHSRAFAAMKDKYLPRFPGTGAVHKFSYFLELYRQEELRDWIKNDKLALDDFVQWVGTERIAKGVDVRKLSEIVRNKDALAAMRTGGSEAARAVLESAQPELTSELFKLMLEMTRALDGARLNDIQRVRKDNVGTARKIVRDLQDSLERFTDLCGDI